MFPKRCADGLYDFYVYNKTVCVFTCTPVCRYTHLGARIFLYVPYLGEV